MKKYILITVASLVLASSLGAAESMKGEHCFRPAFQKKLKRVKSVGLRSLNSMGLKQTRVSQKAKKKAVFIDWRKLYWGALSDLIYSEEETYMDDVHVVAGTEEKNISSPDTEENQAFAKELRQELKSFAKQYGLKIVWRKKSLGLVDGTAAFLEYWDKGFSQEEPSKIMPFADLCALSVKDTRAKDINAKGAISQLPPKNLSCEHVPFENALFANPLFKKGA